MKRYAAGAAGLLLSVMLCAASYGAETGAVQTVEVKAFDMTMEFPEGWMCFTTDMTPDDPAFARYGMDGAALIENWKKMSIYMDATDLELECTLVCSRQADFTHLTEYSDSEIRKTMDSINSADSERALEEVKKDQDGLQEVEGMEVSYQEIMHTDQAVYMVGDTKMDWAGTTTYGIQYYTVVNGNVLSFQFFDVNGNPITEEQRQFAAERMESVHFGHLDKTKPLTKFHWDLLGVGLAAAVGGCAGVWYYRSRNK